MESKGNPLFVLTGCTAVGKTEMALSWAESRNAEIVSCDSLLFYRHLDVGAAKPTSSERARVPHHLIDIKLPSEQVDIGEYVEMAIQTVEEIWGRERNVLVTGGSGFYLKAFFEPVVDSVLVSPETRAKVLQIDQEAGVEGMLKALKKIDPNCEEEIDTKNPRRVVKALERCLETGESVRTLKTRFQNQRNPLIDSKKNLVVLKREKSDLNVRIEKRVFEMLDNGLIDEVERLKEFGFESNPSAVNAIGYRETLEYLSGRYDRDTLIERIATNTRRLAKKQRTWFRTQLPDGKRVDLTNTELFDVDLLFN
ncbi:MAG: tRNA (adenosine(37)-N6)-dimethylallyltransferase MiaA [Verrucomicrobiota bacterium]|nr:tRNA (adenosine(37)-N6)-dimethylallyltransferase MiaA [Verrucomicrobiota bacterium]